MADARRYLRQLLELGESDLVLEPFPQTAPEVSPRRAEARPRQEHVLKGDAAPVPGGPSGPASAEVALQGVAAKDASEAKAGAAEAPATRWGGPAMYGPGIVVQAPPSRDDLFSADPIAQLASLDAIAQVVATCTRCQLGHSRLTAVPGEGHPRARLACVGEAPGATEDETGRPFVGRAGKLLEEILKSIALAREDVFICNVLKCRPPGNRTPEPLEVAACSPYLHRQLELIRPKVILALGKPAATTLLGTNASLGDLRGRIHRYRGIPLVVTYHPAALLRNPHWKGATWDDVRIARRIFDGEAV